METNNPYLNQQGQIQGTPCVPVAAGLGTGGEKRMFSPTERLLMPIALVIAVLYDRLVFAPVFRGEAEYSTGISGAFWLCYLVAFYAFYWKKLSRNRVLWFVAVCAAALCIWSLMSLSANSANIEFRVLTYLVLPSVLMAHAQFAAGDHKLKDAGQIAVAWLTGWVIKPFSGLPALFGVAGSLFSGDGRPAVKRVALGVGITLPLICVIIPLLSSADQVFGYYLWVIMGGWELGSLIGHAFVVVIAFALFYSFFWNIGFGANKKAEFKTAIRIDAVVSCIVLGSISLIYALFCAVQFTYLFAGAGLPEGMTYSEYAREGFAQTIAVCAINLLVFAVFLQFGNRRKAVSGFLYGLLALTGVMLFSGFVRLRLYIGAYGLTWLRLLSAWFVIYLAVIIILCGVRMLREKLPAIAMCALILLGWYVALGYLNPDAFIARYNQSHNYETVETR